MAINPNAETSANLCRKNGWGPGTRIVGDEGYGPTVIRITAVGEAAILAVVEKHGEELYFDATEKPWTLLMRKWELYKDEAEVATP